MGLPTAASFRRSAAFYRQQGLAKTMPWHNAVWRVAQPLGRSRRRLIQISQQHIRFLIIRLMTNEDRASSPDPGNSAGAGPPPI